jgi:hypothetical protein
MCVSNLAHIIDDDVMEQIEPLLLETDWDKIEESDKASRSIATLLAFLS